MWSAFGMKYLDKLAGNSSTLFGTDEKVKERERQDAMEDYKTKEREGIIARVEGAKAAGLHPLAALGFQAGSDAPIPIGNAHNNPTYSSGSSQPKLSASDQAYRDAQTRLANAQATEIETRVANANRNLATQPGNPPPMLGVTDSDNLSRTGLKAGIEVVPSKITAGKGGYQAGTHQGAATVRIPLGDGHSARLRVPGNELSQGLEDMDVLKTLITLSMNRKGIQNFLTSDIPWAVKGWLSDLTRSNQKVADEVRERRNMATRPRGGR